MRKNPVALARLLLLGVVFVWGATFPMIKAALADAPPLLFNLLRMAIAAALLGLLNRRALRRLNRTQVRYGVLAGVFLGLGYQFQTTGLARTTASKSAFITGLVVVIVPLLSGFCLLRPPASRAPRWNAFAGAITAFCGLVLLSAGAGGGLASLRGFGLGEALTLVCAIAFAGHLLTLSHAGASVDAPSLATLQVAFAAALMAITLPLGGSLYFHPTPRLAIALAVTSLLATAVAFTVQSWAQQHLSSAETALLVTMEPVFAWLVSLTFFHERLGPRELAGAVLILAGILVAELIPVPCGNASHPSAETFTLD